jgi:hypothetical protein
MHVSHGDNILQKLNPNECPREAIKPLNAPALEPSVLLISCDIIHNVTALLLHPPIKFKQPLRFLFKIAGDQKDNLSLN